MNIETVNPATGKSIQSYEIMSNETLNTAIEHAHQTFLEWRKTSFDVRKKHMKQLANVLRNRQEECALLITREMGKLINQARAEIEKCAKVCEFYADNAEQFLQPRTIQTDMQKNYVMYQPLGAIYAIMPWNFPFWQVFRFLAPNLMAGNTGLLSHAQCSTGAGLMIEQLTREAGFPEHAFKTLVIDYDQSTLAIEHPYVAAVTLTGSERAGKAVGSEAGHALKKVILELGGSDPYIILEDANLEKAAKACIISRLNNAGQVCIAAKRIIVVDAVFDAFQQHVEQLIASYKIGNPEDEQTTLAPMARKDLRDGLHKQVEDSIKKGAQLICGGVIPDHPGFYYPATLLTHVKKGMPAFDEELFGPVVTLIRAQDEAEAIRIANESPYGLAGAVFTEDIARGERVAHQIETGSVAINTFVASDPRLPFGGIKRSGYGRELSVEGIHAFMNVKTISIA